MVTGRDRFELAVAGASLDAQKELLERALSEGGLSPEVVAASMSQVYDGFYLWESSMPTSSRMGGGGSVRLPTGAQWPHNDEPLTFLFEIDMADLIGVEGVQDAPSSGAFLLFQDEHHGYFWTSPPDATCIMHRASGDEGWVTTEGAMYDEQPLKQLWLTGAAFPMVDTDEVGPALRRAGWDRSEAYAMALNVADVVRQVFPVDRATTSVIPKLLGAPSTRQGLLSGTIANWFDEPEAERCAHLYTEAEREGEGWRLFLDPDEGSPIGLDWTTAGSRFHVIPEKDLKAGRYDRAITVYQ